MPLKAKEDPDTSYVVDMNLIGSPTKQTANKLGTNAVLYTQNVDRTKNSAAN